MTKQIISGTIAGLALMLATGCSSKVAEQAGPIDPVALEAKPLYEFTEKEVGPYLAHLQQTIPSLPDRVVAIGRQNLGQPYELYLLGEAPFEVYDPQPLYNLQKSDCVVFCEHTYAMALSDDWPSFFKTLQRLRYKDGEISVLTRNHYTEVDWNTSNQWLLRDLTEELVGDDAVEWTQNIRRSRFFENRYDLQTDIPDQEHTDIYVPWESVADIEGQLRNGDFVNVVRGRGNGAWVGHTGLIAIGEDGTVNLLHSTPPRVREEPLAEYIRRSRAYADKNPEKAGLLGFKFLRLRENPLENLRAIDGPDAPRVKPPSGALLAPGGE